ncbi:hypothetical protein DSO57_1039141 [Entomophthora muscae]|uniref:Uncharacterized protein n=1 Tax=Entomophthora muscae TaxID=34485 RepID=A0ACC2S0C2_9FUNG|nr:hypothetical protein DSO57_1039141 [Entomophthora muscae]
MAAVYGEAEAESSRCYPIVQFVIPLYKDESPISARTLNFYQPISSKQVLNCFYNKHFMRYLSKYAMH